MNLKGAILSALACALAACSTPLVYPDIPSMQHKMGYVHDWDELAERTAATFVSECQCDKRVVFVAPGPSDMPFAGVYRKLLEEKLAQRHVVVKENAADALVVSFDVQAFLYGDDRRKKPADYFSFWSTATALTLLARAPSSTPVLPAISRLPLVSSGLSLDNYAGIAAGAGPVLDLLAEMNDTTNAEVLLTVTVRSGEYLHYSDSTEFYIHPSDLPFYWTRFPDFTPQLKSADSPVVSLRVRSADESEKREPPK